MNKFIIFIVGALFGVVFVQNHVNAALYWCNSDKIEGTYDTERAACGQWKEFSADMYNHCQNLNKTLAQAYSAGKCEPILERKYEENGAICTVQYIKSRKKFIGTSCSGKNIDQLRSKIEKIYK